MAASGSVRTVYRRGAAPQLQVAPQHWAEALRGLDEVWRMDLSAKDFAALIEGAAGVTVEEKPSAYVIGYEAGSQNSAPIAASPRPRVFASLIKATLVLSRADLHPIEQTLIVQVEDHNPQSQSPNAQLREYRLMEASFERRPPGTVAPAVFTPEPELLGSDTGTRRHGDTETVAAMRLSGGESPRPSVAASSVVATAELEIEVLRLLNQAGADLGEQVSVARTPERQLQVQALVETERRKGELLQALNPIKSNPAVRIEVSTVAEALKANPPSREPAAPLIVQGTATGDSIPAYPELRRYFASRGVPPDQIDQEVRRLATRELNRSYQMVQRAMALKRLAGRFAAEDLRTLEAEARAKWLAMIRGHAQTLEQENAALRRELGSVFTVAYSEDAPEEADIRSDAELVQAADRLYALCSANDRVTRSALAISPETERAAAIKTPPFWRALKSAERLAAKIQDTVTSGK